MTENEAASTESIQALRKCPSGIIGLDELTGGGLPFGRTTLVCGGPGCGKTLFGVSFLVKGALNGEPGVLVLFEENFEEICTNVASLGYELKTLVARGLLRVEHIHVQTTDVAEIGDFDLEALLLRLRFAVERIGARRIAIDTLEVLFSGFTNHAILRAEIRRLFTCLKHHGITAVVTAELGERTMTRHGLEEYVSDCVVRLDHRVVSNISTRRLRVVKYRGSAHGTNEYPFLIDESGISVMPITSAGLAHPVSRERLSTGVADLDAMLGGGVFRGSAVLISGSSGTGKSNLAARFADAACRRGERCLYFAFEESPHQIVRNVASIGTRLDPWIETGRLRILASRPSLHGLEMHLAIMHREFVTFRPDLVVFDTLSALQAWTEAHEAQATVLRLADDVKTLGITSLFLSLRDEATDSGRDSMSASSLIDTYVCLLRVRQNGTFRRYIYIQKSRGMRHSEDVRELVMNDDGIAIGRSPIGLDDCTGTAGT